MTANPHILGVDFGTSNSAAGMWRNNRPYLFEVEAGQKTLPTTFFFDFDTRETLIGSPAAKALIEGRDGRFMRALKRILGTPLMHEPRQILNERVTFVEIIARFLGALKSRAEAEAGHEFTQVLSGRPVHFHDRAIDRDAQAEDDLRACYLAAGFNHVEFMLEPEAAAIACGMREGRGLIVDIGGGTSDFSVFEVSNDRTVHILANHGARIGGTDFDRSISIDAVMPLLGKGSQLRKELGAGLLDTPNAIFNDLATWEKIPFLYNGKTRKLVSDMAKLAMEPEKLQRLSSVLTSELGHDIAFAVEAGKIEANTTNTKAQIELAEIELGLNAPVTPAGISQALGEHMNEISLASQETLRLAGFSSSQIDRVIYVGGSSLISLVPSTLNAIFPNARHEFSEVFTAVADGLAIASGRS